MQESAASRATAAARSTASSLGLTADDAVVLHNSNKLTVRLLPCDVLATANGPLFIDLETCCRGPVEFDLAHAPEEVSGHYPGVNQDLLRDCRVLVLAMVTTWRWDRDDQFPNGRRLGTQWLGQIRSALEGGVS